ncbi:hypothetical protein C496_19505 [Natronorubrum tibetense GA33]|uniref:Uncharacterized protein n=1 Tax=Natronorubrum tibetense GA33 TaxID=1114856 RepID=L9VL83_9EURY|nr:hypothetical protein C496_19505 [Natronorubrum tibetense GA33]
MFLSKTVQERRSRVSHATAEYLDFEQEIRFCVDRGAQAFFSSSISICFLPTATCDGSAVGGSLWASE